MVRVVGFDRAARVFRETRIAGIIINGGDRMFGLLTAIRIIRIVSEISNS